jgi:FAD binding domain in molybdopterin dehydrogenase
MASRPAADAAVQYHTASRTCSYAASASVAEAVGAIAAAGPGAWFLASGTTLYDLMKRGVERPSALVDVSRLAELTVIDTSGADELVFGGGARMADVAAIRWSGAIPARLSYRCVATQAATAENPAGIVRVILSSNRWSGRWWRCDRSSRARLAAVRGWECSPGRFLASLLAVSVLDAGERLAMRRRGCRRGRRP